MKDKKKSKKIVKKKITKKPKKVTKKPNKITKQSDIYVSKHGKREKKIKIRYGRLFIFLVLFVGLLYLGINYIKIPISNFYISGNEKLSDQEIIDKSGLRNYPSVLSFTNYNVKKKLEKDINIKNATIKKKFRKVYIEIEENYPLFYSLEKKETLMYDGRTTKDILGPILLNHITDKVYDLYIDRLKLVDRDILDRISEIKYDPNTVDEERFLFTMSDGNYVYITLEKIEVINNYVEIIKTFDNKKGILYLDSGEYFEVF